MKDGDTLHGLKTKLT